MIHLIENENFTVGIDELGAELTTIKSKKTGIEYLWQGNKKYWTGRAPVLFPICGRLYGGKYTYLDKEYQMSIHGFIKDSILSVTKKTKSEITFTLVSNDDTKKIYPFDFEFSITYALNGCGLKVTYSVNNTGKKDMFFSFGNHTGFNVPFNRGEKFDDYYLEFDKDKLRKIVLSEDLLYTDKREEVLLTDRKIPLKHELFDDDGIFLEADCGTVKLKSKNGGCIAVSFSDMTALGFWQVAKSDAPYICIEPWHGVPAYSGKVDDFSDKKDSIILGSGKKYKNSVDIRITEKE